jgi:hypothetical protein
MYNEEKTSTDHIMSPTTFSARVCFGFHQQWLQLKEL